MTSQSEPQRDTRRGCGQFVATVPQIMRAQNQGAKAVNDNHPVSSCPYRSDRTDRGRFLAIIWFRAYSARQQQIMTGRSQLGHAGG
jgi:hypothetical protein